ncbi:unnamed protein product [Rotaria sp. Silwood1]|nr:unnamed protein product [Rotaria sp. Silwood1]
MYINKLDLKDYLKNFDIKPDKLGENLYENYQNNESDQYSIDPLAPDEEFVCKAFPDSQSVLQRRIHISTVDRPVNSISYHRANLLTKTDLFDSSSGLPSINRLVQHLQVKDRLDKQCALHLVNLAQQTLEREPNILVIQNHETHQIAEAFQFKLECQKKYGSMSLYDACMIAFDTLPICAVIDSRFLCMHGGIPPDIQTLSDIEKLNRFMEIPYSDPLCDFLWSDLSEDFDQVNEKQPDFKPNNVPFQFGERFITYYTTHILLSLFNMYSPEELAAEDGRQDKTAVELLNKKRLIETMDQAYSELKETNNIVLNLSGLTPSYHAYKDLLVQPKGETAEIRLFLLFF